MSTHIIQLTIDVNDEELADHVKMAEQRGGPYTRRVRDWNASDVFRAADHEIIDPGDCEFDYIGKVEESKT